ncbi:conserved hypothetical protein [Burkholderia cepacia]|nr:conserved hypothetical protein [Burkholderia cepacia]SOT39853.1 hypothetical protein F01_230197 [Burkholderia cenocepacia]
MEVWLEDPECLQKKEVDNVHLEYVADHMQRHVYGDGRD